jgi:hypothetical protein
VEDEMKKLFLFFVTIFMSENAFSEIIYTDVNPDTTLRGSLDNIWDKYYIDIDKDGNQDFTLTHFFPSADLYYAEFEVNNFMESEILVDSDDHPLALNAGTQINNDSQKWLPYANYAIHLRENWKGSYDKYLGLRLKKANNWHYCWIRLSIPQDESYCALKDFAFESNSNTGLIAGGTDISSVNSGLNEDFQLQVYPNPACNILHLKSTNPYIDVNIFNNSGLLLFHKCIDSEGISIDVSGFPEGVFVLKSNYLVKKFVKIK